ncbi:VOC family protein [bacterium]|nr:VOC family protein [bacterium]
MNEYTLPDTTRIGYVHLIVSNADEMLAFYRDLLGFHAIQNDDGYFALSANGHAPYHIMLTENRHAKPRQPHTTGLFHLAIRVPNRIELARMFFKIHERRYPFQGFADHGVSEALYMADPEGNGVEIYVDKARDLWPNRQGRLQMTTDPLDVKDLVKELINDRKTSFELNPETDIGHIHLQVSTLSRADKFYHGILGMNITQDSYPGALFLSAGGYHHHIGANIWSGEGAVRPGKDSLGLAGFAIHIPDSRNKDHLLRRFSANRIEISQTGKSYFTHDLDHNPIELIFE